MTINITYMGTKRKLTPAVSEVLAAAQPGTLLDAFSGMCAVGAAVGPSRQIWTNDVQIFASEVATALFCCRDAPASPLSYADEHFSNFRRQSDRLSNQFPNSLTAERELLITNSFHSFEHALTRLKAARESELSTCRLRSSHLFTKIYSANFFGMQQAIEADSIYESLRLKRENL
jgi:adenine-specific DNA-methyltransferase